MLSKQPHNPVYRYKSETSRETITYKRIDHTTTPKPLNTHTQLRKPKSHNNNTETNAK